MASLNEVTQIFSELGDSVRDRWVQQSYSEDAFVEISSELLEKSELHKKILPEDILNLALFGHSAIDAHQVDSPFGDIQIITYKHTRFYIEVLYWKDGTTAIHDHGFSGAFCVIDGASIHAEYQFNQLEKVNHHFALGKLSDPNISKIIPGNIQPIHSGKRFIHSTFHLENPTISIVIRTIQDDDAMPQFEYRGGHLKLVEGLGNDYLKKIQSLRFINTQNPSKFNDHFMTLFMKSALDEQYWLGRAFYKTLNEDTKSWSFLWDNVNEKTQIILKAIEEEALLYNVIKLRANIDDNPLRYFLALLLNLPKWTHIASFIGAHSLPNNLKQVETWLTQSKAMGLHLVEAPEYFTDLWIKNNFKDYQQKYTHYLPKNAFSKLFHKRILADVEA